MKRILLGYVNIYIYILLTITLCVLTPQIKAENRLHVITVADYSDALILESNGHFAMIDTGEDFSYPDGSNPKYPDRKEITKDRKKITEDRLLAHINELGIKKFDFILITHAHSDHIGAAHDILKAVPTDKLYIKKYTDDRISDKTRLWDNLYSYDRALQAAKETDVKVIQEINDNEAKFKLGDIDIQLFNYKNEYDENGSLKKVYDENLNSILSLLTINNTKIFLGGDLENTELEKEDYYAPLIGKVDVMKFNHHVETTKSNTKNFVDTLNPKYMIKTAIYPIENDYKKYLDSKNIQVINAGRRDVAAVVLEFNNGEVIDASNNYEHHGFFTENNILKFKDWNGEFPEEGWYQHNDSWYFFGTNGVVATKWQKIGDIWFYFDESGKFQDGLIEDNNNYYYIDSTKGMISNDFASVDNKTIFLKKDGTMAKNEWENFRYFDNDGALVKNKWIGLLYVNNDGKYNPLNPKNLPLVIALSMLIIYISRIIIHIKYFRKK